MAFVVAALLSGCGDDRDDGGVSGDERSVEDGVADEAANPGTTVPWSAASSVVAARRGEYRQVLTSGSASRPVPMIEEWVTYDLDVPLVDRRMVTLVDATTGEPTGATRANPTLRVLYRATATYMSSPRIEAQCGTAWAEVTPDQAAAMTGAPIDSFQTHPVIEPIEILRTADPGVPPDNDADASVYTIAVPGETGLQMTSRAVWDQPGVVERIEGLSTTAAVRLPRDGGPVEITVDLAGAMEAAGRPLSEGQMLTTTWEITAPVDGVDTTVPAEAAAPGSCDVGPPDT